MTKFTHRTRLQVAVLEDRTVPSGVVFDTPPALPALTAVADHGAVGPPFRVSPVFALNFGATESLPALPALTAVADHGAVGPPFRVSPVFFGLAHFTPPESTPPPTDSTPPDSTPPPTVT